MRSKVASIGWIHTHVYSSRSVSGAEKGLLNGFRRAEITLDSDVDDVRVYSSLFHWVFRESGGQLYYCQRDPVKSTEEGDSNILSSRSPRPVRGEGARAS